MSEALVAPPPRVLRATVELVALAVRLVLVAQVVPAAVVVTEAMQAMAVRAAQAVARPLAEMAMAALAASEALRVTEARAATVPTPKWGSPMALMEVRAEIPDPMAWAG